MLCVWCCCMWNNSFLFFFRSSTLPLLRHDFKWAVCHVPKKSCRGRNDETKEEPRNPQVPSPSHYLTISYLFSKAFPSSNLFTVTACWHWGSFFFLLGESMFPPVPLRGTLTCLRIWRRRATRWPALLKYDVFGTSKFETIQSSSVQLCAFLSKDAYF